MIVLNFSTGPILFTFLDRRRKTGKLDKETLIKEPDQNPALQLQ